MPRTLFTLAILFITLTAQAREVGLTVYSSADPAGFNPQRFIAEQRLGYNPSFVWQVPGFGIVRDTRDLDLKQGTNTVSFTDVAQFIDPTTVSLTDLSVNAAGAEQRGLRVLEQDFQFDLVSASKILDKYVDQKVTLNLNLGDGKRESITGTLLSNNQGSLVLKTDQGLRILNNTGDIQLGELPGGLLTRPTLLWQVHAPAAGPRKVRTAYQTDGITWRSDYNLVLNAEETAADLGAWVTIMNLTGTSFEDATLKLIAGDVQRVQPERQLEFHRQRAAVMMDEAEQEGFEEKSFFEYHLYTLPRKTTIAQNAVKQIALFPTVRDVKTKKTLVYYGLPESASWGFFPRAQTDRDLGNQSNPKVDVYIQFENKEDNQLGIPLPAGKMRVFKYDDADNSLEFIGEDVIDHTPKNNKVLVKIGQSFDVTGERTQTDFKIDANARWIEESFQIKVTNAKDKPQDVVIRETLYRWSNWEILRKTDDFEKIDSRTIHFNVQVPPEGSKVVRYTVKYSW